MNLIYIILIDKTFKNNEMYKILTLSEYLQFNRDGFYQGNDRDIKDGYIHMCSTLKQTERLIKKYYSNTSFVILNLNFTDDEVVYEESNGEIYPHYYNGPLKYSYVV